MGRMRQFTIAMAFAGALLAGAFLGVGSTARAADVGANDDTGKYLGDAGASMYGDMAALGLRQIVLPVRFKPSEPIDHPGQGAPRQDDPGRAPCGPAGRPRRLSVPDPRARGGSRDAVALRLLRRRRRVDLPGGEAVRRRQRAEPAGVLAPAVQLAGTDALGAGLRPVPRDRLRRAEGGGPGDQSRGRRPLAARERPPQREEQRLHVSGAVPARSRELVPRERPRPAADGRVQLPSLPEQGDGSARQGLRLAERRIREPRPREAGALGRVPRDGPADDARGPEDPPRRGRLAGGDLRASPATAGSRTSS